MQMCEGGRRRDSTRVAQQSTRVPQQGTAKGQQSTAQHKGSKSTAHAQHQGSTRAAQQSTRAAQQSTRQQSRAQHKGSRAEHEGSQQSTRAAEHIRNRKTKKNVVTISGIFFLGTLGLFIGQDVHNLTSADFKESMMVLSLLALNYSSISVILK